MFRWITKIFNKNMKICTIASVSIVVLFIISLNLPNIIPSENSILNKREFNDGVVINGNFLVKANGVCKISISDARHKIIYFNVTAGIINSLDMIIVNSTSYDYYNLNGYVLLVENNNYMYKFSNNVEMSIVCLNGIFLCSNQEIDSFYMLLHSKIGNDMSVSCLMMMDNTAPRISINNETKVVIVNDYEIEQVFIYRNGTIINSFQAQNWKESKIEYSYNINQFLLNGTNNITILAMDISGNSNVTNSFILYKESIDISSVIILFIINHFVETISILSVISIILGALYQCRKEWKDAKLEEISRKRDEDSKRMTEEIKNKLDVAIDKIDKGTKKLDDIKKVEKKRKDDK